MKKLKGNPSQNLTQERTGGTPTRPGRLNIPVTENTTTADQLLYLKDCLDNHIIDEALFRSLRDELTYGRGIA